MKYFKLVQKFWDDFFFKPTSPATLGIFRIAFGLVTFLSILGKFPYRNTFYSDLGVVTAATTAKYFPQGHPFLYFQWVPSGDPALMWYFIAILAAALCFTVGLFTRVATVACFLGLITLSNRNFLVDNSGDDLMRINFFFLMFTNAGAAYSVDKWMRVKRGLESAKLTPISPWVQRLLQIQLAYLYFDTWQLKLLGAGWRDGTAMYYALNYIELRRFDMKWFFYYLWQIKFMTYAVMVGEFGLAFLIWFRKFRYPLIAIGIILHEGINLTMQFPVFQYVMIASLLNFVYPEDTERWIAKARQFLSRKRAKLQKSHGKRAA